MDPGGLEAALDAWDFNALVMAHGRLVSGDEAHAALERAWEGTLARVPPARAAPAVHLGVGVLHSVIAAGGRVDRAVAARSCSGGLFGAGVVG